MTVPDDALIDDLYITAHLLGIKPQDAKDAIERYPDKRELLRRWKREHERKARGVLISHGRALAKANSDQAAEKHTELQRAQAESRRAARERMPLGQRIDALRTETTLEPGPGVAALGSTKILGGEGDQAPPDASEIRSALNMTFRAHWVMFERHIEMLEAEWDEFLGRGVAKNWWTASAEEKDREIINRYMGIHSGEVAKIAPWLGSKRKVELVRLAHKLRPLTGEPK